MKLEWSGLERVLETFIINDSQRVDDRGFVIGTTSDGVMELCAVLSAIFDHEQPRDTARSDINFLKPRGQISEANRQLISDARESKNASAFGQRQRDRYAKGPR